MIPRLVVFLAIVAATASGGTKGTDEFVNHTLYPATALLYSQDESGGMKMRCTATSIEKTEKGYVFVTAAHCGCQDNTERKQTSPEKTFFYITADEPQSKTFIKAEVTGCGYRHRGDDFMLLEVESKEVFPVVALGDDPVVLEPVINVASPLGLGKQVFSGSVSGASLNRPVVEDDINWTGAVLLQMFGVDGGSSGSSVVCLDQQAICAFVVGSVDKSTITAMPVSRLKTLRKALADKTYHYWVKDSDAAETK
jgi:hypothetical protein